MRIKNLPTKLKNEQKQRNLEEEPIDPHFTHLPHLKYRIADELIQLMDYNANLNRDSKMKRVRKN